MKKSEFIKTVLIEEIGKVQKAGLMYHSFFLIWLGLVNLGKIMKKNCVRTMYPPDYIEIGLSYMKPKYKILNTRVHDIVSMMLSGVPYGGIELCERRDKLEHLQYNKIGATDKINFCIVAEDLYEDFVDGCKNALSCLDTESDTQYLSVDI